MSAEVRDVEAMCAWLESMANTMSANDDLNIFGHRVERLREAAAMLRSLDASLTAYRNPHTVWQCEQNGCCFEDMRRRIAALEAERDELRSMVISKQIQIDTLEMLRERDAPPVDHMILINPPPATKSNSSGDSSSSSATTGATGSTDSTGFSMDAPVCAGEVPSGGTIDQYHEPGLGLNKGDY